MPACSPRGQPSGPADWVRGRELARRSRPGDAVRANARRGASPRGLGPPHLASDEVLLESFTDGDVSSLWAGEDDQFVRRSGLPAPFTRRDMARRIADWQWQWAIGGRRCAFAVREARTRRLVGGCILERSPSEQQIAELSYWIYPPYRRRGYAACSVELATRYAFDVLKVGRVDLQIEPLNGASIGVAARTGFLRRMSRRPDRPGLVRFSRAREERQRPGPGAEARPTGFAHQGGNAKRHWPSAVGRGRLVAAREALTRGPCPGRRDRTEPLARPTREASGRDEEVRGHASRILHLAGLPVTFPPAVRGYWLEPAAVGDGVARCAVTADDPRAGGPTTAPEAPEMVDGIASGYPREPLTGCRAESPGGQARSFRADALTRIHRPRR
jgi:RimJ/RimL family protein N-acetyltransferase